MKAPRRTGILRQPVGGLAGVLVAALVQAGAAGADPYGGLETVAIQDEHLRLVVVPQVGGRIAELVERKTGVNHLLRDAAAFQAYRELDIGEGHLLLAGGLFDVVSDTGRGGYPGRFQCAPYQARVEERSGGPAVVVSCRRGAVEVTRRMSLLGRRGGLRIDVTYRNVSDRPITSGVNLRAEFPSGRQSELVAVPARSGRIGLFGRCAGLGRLAVAGGWVLLDRGPGGRLLLLFDADEVEFVRGFSGRGMYALTIQQTRRAIPPGRSVSLAVEVRLPADAEAAAGMARGAATGGTPEGRSSAAAALKLLLDNMEVVRRHPTGLSVLAPWGLVAEPKVAYRRSRPWARERTEYAAGDPVRLVARCTPFAKPGMPAPKGLALSARLRLPTGEALQAARPIPMDGEAAAEFPADRITAAGPFVCEWSIAAADRRLATGRCRIRYHHRGDPRIGRLLGEAKRLLGDLGRRDDLAGSAKRGVAWIVKRIEYAENLHETGDFRYRPFCHGRALDDCFGASSTAIYLLEDAIRCAKAVLAGRAAAAELPPGGHVFAYDLAEHGAKLVAFDDADFRRKLARFADKVDALARRPEAAKDIGWYRMLHLLGRRALEGGIRADDGDAPAARASMHRWLDDVLARIEKWPQDGWRKGKFRFPYEGMLGLYTKRLERYRGYSAYVPSSYDGTSARPVLVDPNSYGNLLPAEAPPSDPDPASLLGAVEAHGYLLLWPGHTNTYSRSGNPEDVRRVIADASRFLKMDRRRFYCAGGSLNADATGYLANSMPDTWAAVAPYSQGLAVWQRAAARIPRVNFQAGREVEAFIKGVRKYRAAGLYDPKIHLGGLYPGVGHCGMNRDMWPFVFDFFARHVRAQKGAPP